MAPHGLAGLDVLLQQGLYLEDVDQNHGVGDGSVQLLLLGHVGQIDQSPGHDAGSAVEEKLEVEPLADARVELDAHHVVVEDVSCELAVNQHISVQNVTFRSIRAADRSGAHQSSGLVGKIYALTKANVDTA